VTRAEVIDLIAATARDFDAPGEVDENTRLFGASGFLDSVGLVSLVLDVEQQVNDRWSLALSLADDRAVSQQRSPFRSVGSLADYVVMLAAETRQGA
jgi:D-alanine--poly(phosphoribitol) ligase subunit 2